MAQNDSEFDSQRRCAASGFSAQVNGASIADLIQINCATRARMAFEVRSENQRGYLFFDQGRLVHAELGGLAGVRAVAVMLGLDVGTFRPTSAPWPARPTIAYSCEALLLRAAQELDDFRRDESSAVYLEDTRTANELPTRPTSPLPRPNSTLPAPTRLEPLPRSSTPAPSGPAPSEAASGVRLDAQGVLVTAMGPQAEAIAETTAFIAPLATLVGEELGLGEIVAVDVSCSDERGVLVFRESTDCWVGARGTSRQLAALRKRIGAG